MGEPPAHVTQLLLEVRNGRDSAKARLIELLHRELTTLARRYMRQERRNHTLQPTALVNEAYIRLLGTDPGDWQNRAHFLAHAAHTMRQVLVDHARGRGAAKRGGTHNIVALDDAPEPALQPGSPDAIPDVEVLALDEALRELAGLDRRQAQIVELRFFGGLQHQEIGAVVGITERHVRRELASAKAWLRRRLTARPSE